VSENKKGIFEKLAKAVAIGDVKASEETAQEVLNAGIRPYEAIIEGLAKGMEVVSDKYDKKEYFLPDLLLSAEAMYAGLNILLPHIPKSEARSAGKVVLGVVEGDVHDIGKNIVKAMLTAAGFEVIDLGRDVPVAQFIEKAKSEGADVIAMSTLMTPTLFSMKAVEDKLKKEGLKNGVKTIIGGGSVSEEWKNKIGSDAYGKDAMEAVNKVKTLIDNIKAAAELMRKKKKNE
jgi:dimethylamine corrinoid protein